MVLVPKLLMLLKICCCDPFPKATTVTTEAIPIIMPSMVKKVRIRCAFIDKIAIRKASPKRSSRERHAETLLFFSCWAEIAVSASGSLCSSVSCSGWLARSAMICPSLISIIREAFFATCISWVTKIMVWPAAFNSRKIRITSTPLCESRAPVGSSARMTSPPFINARAMETRCCCPPESWLGRFWVLLPSPNSVSKAVARCLRAYGVAPA